MKLRLLMAASICLTYQSLAQAPSDAPIVYEPEFFERFVPQTALDMVERVPGFSLDQGENRRGLAGAAGNVLIDGRVPVVKGQGIRGFLRRIPAATVQRLELIRGSGTSASNAQSVRLNIVRVAAGGSGVWRATLDHTEDDRVSPSVDASWTGRVGQIEYRLSGDYRKWHDPETGTEVSLDAFDALEERVIEKRVRDDDRIGISGELNTPVGSGEFTLVGALEIESGETGERAELFTPQDLRDGLELVQSEMEGESGELSATYSQNLSGWNSELSALILRQETEDQQISFDFAAGDVFEERTDEFETSEDTEIVLRAVASRPVSKGAWTLEGELAFNKLDQSLRLTENNGAGPVLVDLPGANTIVEELRGEFGATRAWEFGPKWSIETGIAYEVSRLRNEGDFSDERDLSFWKPSLQITRKIGDDDQIRFRLFRDVDQLDFEDFAASVELDNDDVNAGNADLRPETSWRAELSGDWRFGDGALEVSLFAWDVEDTQDFALIETETDRFDTQGNIGDGTVYGLNARIETPIQWVPGSTLVLGGNWQDSEVEDPLTGETRQQSDTPETSFEIEFRQDIETLALAWGVEFETETQAPQFRFDRVTESQDRDRTRLWVETTALGNFKLNLSIDDFTGALETRDRRRFDPDRLGLLDRLELRERDPGMSVRVRLQGTF